MFCASGCRLLATPVASDLLFGLSVWLKSTTNLIFSGLCILALPLLWGGTAALFTHGGLLSGTRMLLWLGESVTNLVLPVVTVTAYSTVVAFFAARRHARGPRGLRLAQAVGAESMTDIKILRSMGKKPVNHWIHRFLHNG